MVLGCMTEHDFPELVIAADWSVDSKKRWMAKAELTAEGIYVVFPPEPVGDTKTLINRIRASLLERGTALIGFDFPIGLPYKYADRVGIKNWRKSLKEFGDKNWKNFYNRSDHPTLHQPFFPKSSNIQGKLKTKLATDLGFEDLSELKRLCDKQSNAECLFFTLGNKQVGAGASLGWKEVLAPTEDQLSFWPFDGNLPDLLKMPGITVAEIYPKVAYRHLNVSIGAGTDRRKGNREHRILASQHLCESSFDRICISQATEAWFRWGFFSDDDFDAIMGLLSMLLVVTDQLECYIPEAEVIHEIEGWILGLTND